MTTMFTASRGRFALLAGLLTAGLLLAGCGGGQGQGEGPGHRAQRLALTPQQEDELGAKAYAEVLQKYHGRTLPYNSHEVERVRTVGMRIAHVATENKDLQHEVNLHLENYRFDWQFNVLKDDQVNAFCLPGGRVAVYTGLLPIAENDDQLATVLSHEIAHALAHHASERVADVQNRQGGLADILSGLGTLAHDRAQESEADHIGLFLMTFAGYNPDQAVVFWERMQQASGSHSHPPEILSDHPSDAKRINQMREWVRWAKEGKKAYDAGRIAR